MSREEFRIGNQELDRIGIIKIASNFYMEPQRRGSIFFVKSPATTDRTASLALYPSSNRFCDFSNANKSGDCIAFVAYIRGCSQWEALKELTSYYGLEDRRPNKKELRRKIQRQQEEERKRAARRQEFHRALFGEIDRLKDRLEKYKLAFEKGKIEPFSDLWACIMNEIQAIECKLDVLCASDASEYRRMKSNPDLGLSSDRPQWLLDCLDILKESGAFRASDEEIKEIIAQKNFELCRVPGRDRRCKIEW